MIFPGRADRQPVGEARQRFARGRRGALGKFGQRLQVAVVLRQPFAEIGRSVAVDRSQIDRLIALDNAKPRSALPLERNDFHGPSLP